MAGKAVHEVVMEEVKRSMGSALARLGPLLLPLAALEPEVVRKVRHTPHSMHHTAYCILQLDSTLLPALSI